ncbi:MAG: hypothetical protein UR28_C0008G0042 [Candidatus Peregrinibacteria bacterium GW2011_GWF2_33_10]|nr:MAG: hypothetical protein UR28_C0008G0042 [Candidatus Peregrinibacteria bacterium GW2011_GWF2_33_10]OGJ44945.1 MAG: hypothetical protein A2272_02780 [Candidatus Peregrinibacteria bacterium RIFOXYA12_FULL_33_12]OGJ45243.1 MAG: hypothetical protein A2263_06755 [Candidatus Peregrinibacteria bacterium RIFOXYA2_FULL_33_21]OGJ51167.1 MAG: hypothetical protein A2307_04840 [Candidatus Peregrinibacteria bacterium RIFOXYB2_FULL_33_20]
MTIHEKPKNQNYIIQWLSPAYIHFQKGWKWFLIAGILIAVATIYSLWQGEILAPILFVLMAGVYTMHYLQAPPMIDVGISHLGLQVGSKFYPFSHIKAFWIHYLPPISTVSFRIISSSKIYRDLSIYLMDQDPVKIRNFLINQIPELEGKQESASNILIRLLKL